jgi:hypothetical protein
MIELPRLDSSLQVALPRLVTSALNALLKAIEDDDVDALERALPSVLATVDTPLERARLARAVMWASRRRAGPVGGGGVALLDLASPKQDSLITSALAQGAAVALGVLRTPGDCWWPADLCFGSKAHTFCAAVGPTPFGFRV